MDSHATPPAPRRIKLTYRKVHYLRASTFTNGLICPSLPPQPHIAIRRAHYARHGPFARLRSAVAVEKANKSHYCCLCHAFVVLLIECDFSLFTQTMIELVGNRSAPLEMRLMTARVLLAEALVKTAYKTVLSRRVVVRWRNCGTLILSTGKSGRRRANVTHKT